MDFEGIDLLVKVLKKWRTLMVKNYFEGRMKRKQEDDNNANDEMYDMLIKEAIVSKIRSCI